MNFIQSAGLLHDNMQKHYPGYGTSSISLKWLSNHDEINLLPIWPLVIVSSEDEKTTKAILFDRKTGAILELSDMATKKRTQHHTFIAFDQEKRAAIVCYEITDKDCPAEDFRQQQIYLLSADSFSVASAPYITWDNTVTKRESALIFRFCFSKTSDYAWFCQTNGCEGIVNLRTGKAYFIKHNPYGFRDMKQVDIFCEQGQENPSVVCAIIKNENRIIEPMHCVVLVKADSSSNLAEFTQVHLTENGAFTGRISFTGHANTSIEITFHRGVDVRNMQLVVPNILKENT